MKKLPFLLALPLSLLLIWCGEDRIDVTDTWFDYNVEICDKYFKLVECIIDNDDNQKYTKQMRIDLKNEIKQVQWEWRQLDEEELTKKCSEELTKFEPLEDNLNSFGCSVK